MTINEQLRESLLRYIRENVDQLIEGVWDFYDDSYVAGNEEDGYYVHTKVRVSYVVHPDVEPRRGIPNLRYFWHDGDMISLIVELDKMS